MKGLLTASENKLCLATGVFFPLYRLNEVKAGDPGEEARVREIWDRRIWQSKCWRELCVLQL